jgi:hypothetical protein
LIIFYQRCLLAAGFEVLRLVWVTEWLRRFLQAEQTKRRFIVQFFGRWLFEGVYQFALFGGIIK